MVHYLIQAYTIQTAPPDFRPGEDEIKQAMMATPGIIGGPRIVRRIVNQTDTRSSTTISVPQTTATILVERPDALPRSLQQIQESLYRRITEATRQFPLDPNYDALWNVVALPYDPAVNGSIEWWRSGTASATPPDISTVNPIGPTTTSDPIVTVGPGQQFQAFILSETSAVQISAPSMETIRSIFRSVTMPPGAQWLGPDPRVTRREFTTYAVWVAFFQNAAQAAEQAASIRGQLQRTIQSMGLPRYNWGPVEQMNIDTRFGTPAFWINGNAARTQTWYGFGSIFTHVPENPYGPDDPSLRPQTIAEWTAGVVRQQQEAGAGSLLWPIAIIATVVAGMYFFGPAGRAISESFAYDISSGTEKRRMALPAPTRQNPRNRRKRRRARR